MLIGGRLFFFPDITLVTQDKEKDLMSMKQVFWQRMCRQLFHTQMCYDSNVICEQKVRTPVNLGRSDYRQLLR